MPTAGSVGISRVAPIVEVSLVNDTYANLKPGDVDLAVYDPPFQMWADIEEVAEAATIACFVNPPHRRHVEALFGPPDCEVVWFFNNGRWVSHKRPIACHEYILIYGSLGEVYVGDVNDDRRPINKGSGSVGTYQYDERIYTPRERKALKSVVQFPRPTSGELGVWRKPQPLLDQLVAWLMPNSGSVWDGFAGSGGVGVAAHRAGAFRYYATELDAERHALAERNIANELSSGVQLTIT